MHHLHVADKGDDAFVRARALNQLSTSGASGTVVPWVRGGDCLVLVPKRFRYSRVRVVSGTVPDREVELTDTVLGNKANAPLNKLCSHARTRTWA